MSKIIYPKLSYAIQGCFYDVYNKLRYLKLSEKAWENALVTVLRERGLVAEPQVKYQLTYKEYKNGTFFVDIVVNNKILLELKATSKLQPIDWAQVITYLKVTDLKLGILVNFGGNPLDWHRIVKADNDTISADSQYNIADSEDNLLYPELTKELRQILYAVHHELGIGFMHMHYRRATQKELRWHDIPYELRTKITIPFRGQPLEERETRLLIVDDKVLLTPIAVRQITPQFQARMRKYLKLLGFELGLIANFKEARLNIVTVRV